MPVAPETPAKKPLRGPHAGAFADPADGRAAARERDPHAACAAQEGPQGRPRRRSTDCCWIRPEYLQTAKVFDLLLAVPKYGRVKVNRILTHCRISPSKTIGGLSERQRNELVSYLRR